MSSATRFGKAATLCLSLAASTAALAQEKGEGPATLVLSYRAKPEHRAAFREHMEGAGIAQFEKWKKDKVFADYQVLFSSYVNEATWDMLAVLSFDRYVDQARWKEIERKMPGGLTPQALAWAAPVTTYVADLTWSGKAPTRDSARAAYLVIPYAYSARAEYKPYAEGYVIPQMKGWLAEGVLSSYSIYLNQNEAGEPWDAMFILEYRDIQGLALRRMTTNKVRAALAVSDAEWKRLSDTKQDVRKEGQVVFADAILAR